MKKGINAWCFPPGYTVAEMFKAAKETRFDGIELNLDEPAAAGPADPAALTLGAGEACWARIKALSEEHGIPVSSLSTGLHWRFPLTDEADAVRKKGVDIVKEMLDAAAYIGCDTILVVPGLVTDRVSYKTACDRSQDAFLELRDYAEKKKVIIGIENVWNKFLLSPLEMAAFIDAVGSAYVKAYFDAGNVLQFSYPQHWAEALGTRIAKVHIKDFDTGIGNMSGFKPLLQGNMPWESLMRALRETGYDDYITAELSPYPAHPVQLLSDTSAAMDYILSLG